MPSDALLTWYQALQLPGLTLCFLIVFFLCVIPRRPSLSIVPTAYIMALTCAFALPLADLFGAYAPEQGVLITGEALIPALSLLLIIQLISGRLPPFAYWAILAVPLVGGSSLVYATLIARGETCLYNLICAEPVVIKQLYDVFSSSLTFLLTVLIHRRMTSGTLDAPRLRAQKHMLIMSLVVLNLAVLAIALGQINGFFDSDRAALAVTVVRVGFMYLVTTSMFRVFDHFNESLADDSSEPVEDITRPIPLLPMS